MKLESVKNKAKKNTLSFKDTVLSHKKESIIIVSVFCALFIIWIVCMVAESTLSKKSDELNSAISQYSNAIREHRNSSLSFSDGMTTSNTNKTYTGALFDAQRWSEDNALADEVFFSKAFNFENWDEYEANRQYFKELFGPDNIFVINVMTAILDPRLDPKYTSDAEKENALKDTHSTYYNSLIASDPSTVRMSSTAGYAKVFLTGMDENEYSYMAIVEPISMALGNKKVSNLYVVRYSVDRSTGVPEFKFDLCWSIKK